MLAEFHSIEIFLYAQNRPKSNICGMGSKTQGTLAPETPSIVYPVAFIAPPRALNPQPSSATNQSGL
jgi:hypothetical protein